MRPAATVLTAIGEGRQRGSPKLCSKNDRATSRPTSTPTRSESSNGPIRNPPATRQMRSMSSTPAMPSDSSRCDSRPNGRLQRLTRNPGPSTASITILPIASPAARATARASGEDSTPATTSSRRIRGAGLKKCMPTTRSGPLAPVATAVTSSEEVLVASTQLWSTTSADRRANSSCLSSSRSGAASITSSQGARSDSAGAA